MNQNLNTQSNIVDNSAAEMQLTASDVATYLLQHPNFFEQHLSLLEQLTIPHPSGSAVSLISKQLELFRQRHHNLEKKLNNLIAIAQENDVLFNRMHELTLAMLEACTLEDAVANLHKVLTDCFLSDFVAMKIFKTNPDSAVANLFVEPSAENLQLFAQQLGDNKPYCGKPTLAQGQFLFGEAAENVQSCAIIPLTISNTQGIIAIGSRKAERFEHSMGTLFLTKMSEIIGARFDIVLADQDAGA